LAFAAAVAVARAVAVADEVVETADDLRGMGAERTRGREELEAEEEEGSDPNPTAEPEPDPDPDPEEGGLVFELNPSIEDGPNSIPGCWTVLPEGPGRTAVVAMADGRLVCGRRADSRWAAESSLSGMSLAVGPEENAVLAVAEVVAGVVRGRREASVSLAGSKSAGTESLYRF
jgi:hypothetical protein